MHPPQNTKSFFSHICLGRYEKRSFHNLCKLFSLIFQTDICLQELARCLKNRCRDVIGPVPQSLLIRKICMLFFKLILTLSVF